MYGEELRDLAQQAVVYGDLLNMDQPYDHMQVRSVITTSPEFKGRDGIDRETTLERYIGELADTFVADLTHRIDAGEEVEITDLASNFTYRTIAHIIGIDLSGEDGAEKVQKFLQVSQQAFLIGDEKFPLGANYVGVGAETAGRSIMVEARRVLQEEHTKNDKGSFLDKLRRTKFTEAIKEAAKELPPEQRKAREDFVGFLDLAAVKASEDFGSMTADDFIAAKLLIILMPAGSETTSTVITRGIGALLEYPEQREVLRDAVSSGELERPVEELVRYASPVTLVARTALKNTVLLGNDIREGERVFAMIGAANHDPAKYTNPWELQLDRDEGRNLAFGTGPHNCPGALLAKTELGILLSKLSDSGILERIQTVSPGLIDRTTPQLRSPKSLLVAAK